jgi:hypothetical protein
MEVIDEQKYFTCIGRGHGAPCLPATRREWEALRKEPWLAQMCERIERGDNELKHRLPVWTPSCAEFKNNHRAAADAIKPLNRLMLDFDEKGHTEEIASTLNMKHETLKSCGIEVLLIEESARRGTHVLVELPEGMAAEQVQKIMQEATGFEPDRQVKGVDRCIYMVPEDHTKLVSERLFEPMSAPPHAVIPSVVEESLRLAACAPGRICEISPRAALSRDDKAGEGVLGRDDKGGESLGRDDYPTKFPQAFKGVPYASIISEYWRRTGGEPSEGERNKRLHQLAANLRAICDNNEEWLLEVMPRFGLSAQEMHSIIHSACKEPTKGSRLIDQIMSGDVSATLDTTWDGTLDMTGDTGVKVNVKALPIGLKESLAGVPATMHMPVLCGVLPIAAAYADQVQIQYCDGNLQHLGLMSIIRGEQASNKSVVKNAVDVWKRQFDEEDALARKREEEWKERKKGRKANEKAPDDPKVLIRMVPVTVSCSTLLKRFKNALGHTIYSFGEELDTLRNVK